MLAGIAESQGTHGAVMRQQGGHGGQTRLVGDLIKTLANLVALMFFQQLHFLGLAQELTRQLGNAVREGGREQQRLSLLWAGSGNVDHVIKEAHVQHAVGFVKH